MRTRLHGRFPMEKSGLVVPFQLVRANPFEKCFVYVPSSDCHLAHIVGTALGCGKARSTADGVGDVCAGDEERDGS